MDSLKSDSRHCEELHKCLVLKEKTNQLLLPLKDGVSVYTSLQNSGTLVIPNSGIAINLSCITNHTNPIVCMLFSYLCLLVKWLPAPSKQHLLVSHMDDFSPQVVKPIRKCGMSFKICLTGRETEICRMRKGIYEWEYDDLCMFKCIGLHKCTYQGSLLITLKWFMPLWFTYSLEKWLSMSLCPETHSMCVALSVMHNTDVLSDRPLFKFPEIPAK